MIADLLPVIVGLPLALLAVGYVAIRALRLVIGIRPEEPPQQPTNRTRRIVTRPYTVTDPNQALKAAGRKVEERRYGQGKTKRG